MNRSSIEAEPSMAPELRREWTARRDQIPSMLAPERNRNTDVRKGPVRRAWDAIPRPVKLVGGAILIGLGLQYFFRFMRDQHAILGKRTHEVNRGLGGATRALNPTSGLTNRGSVVSSPGDGAIDKDPNIGGSSDRTRRLQPGDRR